MSAAAVLIARFLAFGDVLLTLPLAEALSRSRAVSHVDVVTQDRFAGLLRQSPHIRQVYTLGSPPPRRGRYGFLLDLHSRSAALDPAIEDLLARIQAGTRVGYANPWEQPGPGRLPSRAWHEHAVEYYARAAGPLIDGPLGPGVVGLGEAAVAAAARLLPPGAVCVTPGARYPWKRWPVRSYAALIGELGRRGIPAAVAGHSFDRRVIERVCHASGAPAIIIDDDCQLAAVLKAGGVVTANNSGLAHLAQAAGARVVCLHSHTLPAMWRPWGDGHVNLTGDPGPCRCSGLSEFERAVPCGKRISVAAVADAVTGLRSAVS